MYILCVCVCVWCSYAPCLCNTDVSLILDLHLPPSVSFLPLYSFLSSHIPCRITCCYEPATHSSFLSARQCCNAPDRDAHLFSLAGQTQLLHTQVDSPENTEDRGTSSKRQRRGCCSELGALRWPGTSFIDPLLQLTVGFAGARPYFLS